MPTFQRKGQSVYYHDEGHSSGYFHTYDALTIQPGRDAPRKVHVFLPKDYESSSQTYPVVYMNDGNTAFWPNGLSPYSWEVPAQLSALYQQQTIPPIIIVAVYPLNRSHEYLHVKEFSSPLKQEGGGLSDYASYLVRLKSFIDGAYRTQRDRSATTVIGSSHGGLAAFYTGCLHSKYFGNVAALSPSFWVGGVFNLRKTPLMTTVAPFLQHPSRPRIWIDWGLRHRGGFHNFFIEAQAAKWGKEMVEVLQQDYGYQMDDDLFCYADALGGHDERAWAYRFSLVLQQYYTPIT